jgi:hypothetical protein
VAERKGRRSRPRGPSAVLHSPRLFQSGAQESTRKGHPCMSRIQKKESERCCQPKARLTVIRRTKSLFPSVYSMSFLMTQKCHVSCICNDSLPGQFVQIMVGFVNRFGRTFLSKFQDVRRGRWPIPEPTPTREAQYSAAYAGARLAGPCNGSSCRPQQSHAAAQRTEGQKQGLWDSTQTVTDVGDG